MNLDPIKDLDKVTVLINTLARHVSLDYCYTIHARERMIERNITTSDVMYVLRSGEIKKFQRIIKLKGTDIDVYEYKMIGDYLGEDNQDYKVTLIILVELNKYRQPAIKIQKIVTSWKG